MKVGCGILAETRGRTARPQEDHHRGRSSPRRQTRDEGLNLALPTLKTSSESYERDINSMQFALDRHIFGSVADVRKRIDEFVEAGVQHFELKIIYPTIDSLIRQMTLWSEEILPHYD
jgi:hypothetical protein